MISFLPYPKIQGGFSGRDLSGLEAVGLKAGDLPLLKQVHGVDIIEIREPLGQNVSLSLKADAWITDQKDQILAIKTADCVPILIGNSHGVIAAVHAGWRGSGEGLLAKVLRCLEENWQAKLSDLAIALGPAICGNCYEVGEEVISGLPEASWRPHLNGKFLLDLKKLNVLQAMEMGVPAGNIQVHPQCTLCEEKFYFSHRGALRRGEKGTGRNYSWVRIVE